jgi:anthranilate synthase component 1
MAVAGAEPAAIGAVPSLAVVRELARSHNLIPIYESFIDDCQTPVSAFLKLREDGPAFLLESADQGRVGRYSFIGYRPRKVLRWSLGDPGDPYALAAAELGRFRAAEIHGPQPSGCSPMTWCARWSHSASPIPIRSAFPTSP